MQSLDAVLQAAKSGDHAALSSLLRAHRDGVYRYGLNVCRTTEDAEDAVQVALWSAARAIHEFRGSASSLVSWMFTMVRRECYRLLEQRRRTPKPLQGQEDTCASDASGPLEALIQQNRSERLATALQQLDTLQREVLLLRDVRELSAPEAAVQLGISVQALKSRLHRARASLRDHVLAQADEF